ncbi:MAG: hypothetical protein L3J12_04315 [Spirochaetales bacterium]|nr:hypothetical protein [Spirochaetales bacterium]
MNSRERMRAILNHKEADKIAVDFGGMHSSGMSWITYNSLRNHLGIKNGEIKIYDVNQQLVLPEQWFLDMFQIDTRDLAYDFSFNDEDWMDWKVQNRTVLKVPSWMDFQRRDDGWVIVDRDGDVLARMGDSAFYFDQEIYPYYGNTKDDFRDIEEAVKKVSWMSLVDPLWKDSENPGFYDSIGDAVKKIYKETDYSIIANYSSIVFEPGQWLYRNDEFFMKMLTDPKEVTALFEKLVEMHIDKLGKLLPQLDGYADVIIFSDDLGMQTAPMISPEMYKELVFPWHKKIFDYVHDNSGLKTFLHSCGSFFDIIPHLINAGLDILNPVQTQCTDMEAVKLKAEYGKDLVFWGGGIDTQNALPFSNEKMVKDTVKKNCEILMQDGGFVFTQIHNMLPGIPPENIVAMYEEVNSIRY